MQGLTIGVYGLYLILVGLKGNAGLLAGKVQDDVPKFLPWIIAIFVLAFVSSSSEAGRKITGPFIALLILAFVLKRFDTLKAQSQELWRMAANAKPTGENVGASGDKTAPAGTVNQAGGNQTLNSSDAVLNAIKSLNSATSSYWDNSQFNYQL